MRILIVDDEEVLRDVLDAVLRRDGFDVAMAASGEEALSVLDADDAVDLAYDKYGDYSIPLAAGRDNYLIVVDDALDAAATLKPESGE